MPLSEGEAHIAAVPGLANTALDLPGLRLTLWTRFLFLERKVFVSTLLSFSYGTSHVLWYIPKVNKPL